MNTWKRFDVEPYLTILITTLAALLLSLLLGALAATVFSGLGTLIDPNPVRRFAASTPSPFKGEGKRRQPRDGVG